MFCSYRWDSSVVEGLREEEGDTGRELSLSPLLSTLPNFIFQLDLYLITNLRFECVEMAPHKHY